MTERQNPIFFAGDSNRKDANALILQPSLPIDSTKGGLSERNLRCSLTVRPANRAGALFNVHINLGGQGNKTDEPKVL